MKRCPSCQRTYPDDTKFCLQDGTPLVADAPPAFGSTFGREQAQPGGPSEPPPAYRAPAGGAPPPPPGYTAPQWQQQAAPRKRKIWPWVLGGVVVAGMGLVVVGLVVAVQLARSASKSTVNVNVNASRRAPNSNAGIPGPPYTSNTNNSDDDSDLAGLDRQAVMTELAKVENDWIRANIKADKKALDRILADEYSGVLHDGTKQTKQEYLDTITPDRTARSWASEDVKLDFEGDKAIISGVLIWNAANGTSRYRFTDTFVKRDGRWQAVSSVTSPETNN